MAWLCLPHGRSAGLAYASNRDEPINVFSQVPIAFGGGLFSTLNGMSSLTLEAVARFLVEYGLLGVLVTMPPALVLILGLKMKNRWTLFASGALFLSLGCAMLGITFEGIATGELLALSRSELMVNRADHPEFFWVSTAAFLAISLSIVALGIFLLGRACSPYNTPSNSDQPKAGGLP